MKPFIHAHATHPQPELALALVATQIEAQLQAQQGHGRQAMHPNLGWLYLSADFAPVAEGLLADAQVRWPSVEWVGAAALGLIADDVEYVDEPAVAIMLAELPREQFRVFSGTRPLKRFAPETAWIHADPGAPELPELIADMAALTRRGAVFGGLPSASAPELALHIANGVWQGGISGVALGAGLTVVSRMTQGCRPLGPERRVSACEGQLLLELDGQPALDCLLQDLTLPVLTEAAEWREALPRLRATLAAVRSAPPSTRARHGAFGPESVVRHLVGIDPARRAVAIAQRLEVGEHLAFCERHADVARRDLVRVCTEIREEANGRPLLGAVYSSCCSRGGSYFGSPSAEAQWLRHGLGDVPLVGFFAGGEIANAGLHSYSGVLSVFVGD